VNKMLVWSYSENNVIKPHSYKTCGQSRFVCHCVDDWNSLPEYISRDELIPEKSRFADPIWKNNRPINWLWPIFLCTGPDNGFLTTFNTCVYATNWRTIVLVCSGKYLLILGSYRSLYESNELMDMGLNTRNKSVKNKTECRLLDYRVIFLKKTKKLRISANSRL
jgi:hypothetical protein